MPNVTLIGLQWGDEGKGKITDFLSSNADIIVRFQGGNNAGHTLFVEGKKYALKLLPSGILRKNKISVIAAGVVIEPFQLKKEILQLRKRNIKIEKSNLKLAENSALIMDFHKSLDRLRENLRKHENIGTTMRGIGPAYEDKIGRRAIRVGDLAVPELLKEKIQIMAQTHNPFLKEKNAKLISAEEILPKLKQIADFILPFSINVEDFLRKAIKNDKNILFEGAQGSMLDIDFGTYPFVTSSNTISAQVSIGSGVPPPQIGYILGVTKAYSTRVGQGPFPTENDGEIGQKLRQTGDEFGTVTGRARRCGWLDAVLLKKAIAISGVNAIALTKLDVLDEFEEIKICTGYVLDDKKIDYLPFLASEQKKLIPVYQTIKGWMTNTKGVDKIDNLPLCARNYINIIEKILETPIIVISSGPKRQDSILIKDPFLAN